MFPAGPKLNYAKLLISNPDWARGIAQWTVCKVPAAEMAEFIWPFTNERSRDRVLKRAGDALLYMSMRYPSAEFTIVTYYPCGIRHIGFVTELDQCS